ncbi:alpha/beta hydrolase [Thalassococcus sp. BH17M4-6]|uniref:alpha/beta hydrolase n=1 Tax=Thalassococcus sp. BH17M4-6 TaxID=3413148 RepID=UPI003BEE02C5
MKVVLWALVLLAVAFGALWAFGPREPVMVDVTFDERLLEGGVDAYLAAQEAQVPGIIPGTEKRVIWSGAAGARTDWAVVYLHGFSATSEEIRPLPDDVARALGANLMFTRMAGHGRDGAAMAEPQVADWMADVAEALAVGRAIGNKVLVIATSTGATFATIAAQDPDMARGVSGMVFFSPNYRIQNPAAAILTWPAVEWWGPLVAGATRSFEPENAQHARYWTTRYPTRALFPMGAAVAHARGLDHTAHTIPALFLFSPEDTVVDPGTTREVAALWRAEATQHIVTVGPGNDPAHHVIAGDILSPGLTAPLTARVLDWVGTLP